MNPAPATPTQSTLLPMTKDDTGIHAQFNPLIKPFLVLKIGVVMMSTIVGIPLAVIWFLGLGRWWSRHYFDRL